MVRKSQGSRERNFSGVGSGRVVQAAWSPTPWPYGFITTFDTDLTTTITVMRGGKGVSAKPGDPQGNSGQALATDRESFLTRGCSVSTLLSFCGFFPHFFCLSLFVPWLTDQLRVLTGVWDSMGQPQPRLPLTLRAPCCSLDYLQ